MNKDILPIAEKRAVALSENFLDEVRRLVASGAVSDTTPLNTLFGVALENIADTYLRGDRKGREYRNLVKF